MEDGWSFHGGGSVCYITGGYMEKVGGGIHLMSNREIIHLKMLLLFYLNFSF